MQGGPTRQVCAEQACLSQVCMMLPGMRCSVVAIVLVQAQVDPDAPQQLPPCRFGIQLAPLSSPLLPQPAQRQGGSGTRVDYRYFILLLAQYQTVLLAVPVRVISNRASQARSNIPQANTCGFIRTCLSLWQYLCFIKSILSVGPQLVPGAVTDIHTHRFVDDEGQE